MITVSPASPKPVTVTMVACARVYTLVGVSSPWLLVQLAERSTLSHNLLLDEIPWNIERNALLGSECCVSKIREHFVKDDKAIVTVQFEHKLDKKANTTHIQH